MNKSIKDKRSNQARILRGVRKVHRYTGLFLFVFFFIIGLTGLLLGWKKNSGGYLTPVSKQGVSTDFKNWLPVDSLQYIAIDHIKKIKGVNSEVVLDRIDIKNGKGMANFIFEEGYWAVQIDGVTGKVLSVDRRRADFIENIHDGMIIDKILSNKKQPFKLVYTSIMGLALLTFTITGFWLWYGPRKMRE
jgi:uncharacterized iron-regulated membrane protein